MPQEKNELVEVTKRDTEGETLFCVDLERNIWVKMGFPRNQDNGIVTREIMKNLSGPPYVFTADSLTLIDNKHPEGATVKDVTVIFMHGGREGTGKWVFSSFRDGYPVVETVEKVNQYLKEKGEKQIQVIMACNQSPSPEEVKVGDFPAGTQVVYAVGETVGLIHAEMSKDGEISATVKAGDFWGLDYLVTEQQIKIL